MAVASKVLPFPGFTGPNREVPFCRDAPPISLQGASLKGKRIAWAGDWGGAYAMEPGILDLCASALQQMQALGAIIDPIPPPFPATDLWQAWTGPAKSTNPVAIAQPSASAQALPAAAAAASAIAPEAAASDATAALAGAVGGGAPVAVSASAVPLAPLMSVAPVAPVVSPAGLLQLQTSAASWIEIRDARSAVLFSRIVRAGESVALDFAPPLRVTVGNAAVTRLSFRGQSVDLSSSTRDNVARLDLP